MKLKTILLFTLAYSLSVLAQANSSYTRFGIGDVQYSYSAKRLGMGEINTSIADVDFINVNNPAALYRLDLTRFELALKFSGDRLSNNSLNKFYANTVFNGFTFGFPVSSLYGIGAAIGIVPVTNISYDVADNISATNSSNNYILSYSGSGGLSKIFLGSSYRTPLGINIGATFNYYFGNLNYNSSVTFPNFSSYNAVYKRKYSPHGIGTTLGLLSPDISGIFNSSNLTEFRIGAAFDYISTLSTDTILIASSSSSVDTIGSAPVQMKIPVKFSAGFSFVLKNKYLFGFDYFYQPWSKYSLNGIKSAELRDASKFSAGFQFKPQRESGQSFWEQFSFRAGLSFEKTQYLIDGQGINKYSVSGGFSIPISLENTIDIGLEYGIRGTKNDGLYRENIYKLNVGISLGDIWFIRQER